jgi:hypothetical protein
MATEDGKYQVVREDDQDYPSGGEWEYVVHDCRTPSLVEITSQGAAVGTVWKCGNCSHRWKLINHTIKGINHPLIGSDREQLQWIRITPIKNEDN